MIFDIVSPILGFEYIKKVELSKIDDFFMKLQSREENDNTSFTLINPYLLREYNFTIPKFYQKVLRIDDNCDILTMCIMIIARPIEESTVNFLAPVIFNITNKKACQVVLDNNLYPNFKVMEKISDYLIKEDSKEQV